MTYYKLLTNHKRKHAMTTNKNEKQLRGTIETIDSISQSAFEEIAAIANLAGAALKNSSPELRIRFASVITALGAIEARADDAMNNINATAEQVGCNYKAARQEVTA